MTNLKTDYKSIIKETSILTVAVAIIAAAVYFFLCTEPCFCEQHIRSWYCAFEFYSLTIVGDYNDFECGLADYRIFTCGREFGVKTVYTSVMLPLFLGVFEGIFPDFGSMTNSQELDVLCYILVVSVGLSIYLIAMHLRAGWILWPRL